MKNESLENDGLHIPIELDNSAIAYGIWKLHQKGGVWKISDFYWNNLVTHLATMGIYRLDEHSEVLVLARAKKIELLSDRQAKSRIIASIISEYKDGIKFPFKGQTIHINPHALQETARRHIQKFYDQNKGDICPLPMPLLCDDQNTAYYFFQNGIVTVTNDSSSFASWNEQSPDGYVWKHCIIAHDFHHVSDGVPSNFSEFITNVSGGNSNRELGFRTGIGYMLHKYTSPDSSKALVLVDEEANVSNVPQGGTGKGVICQAISQMVRNTLINGKQFKPKERFAFQSVEYSTNVIQIDDVQENFKYDDMFSSTSEGVCIEKKQQTPYRFAKQKSPKFMITSNQPFTKLGKSYARRFHVLPLSPFYSDLIGKVESPLVHIHKARFFTEDWSEIEWNRFFSYMLECVQLYLRMGLCQASQTAIYVSNVERWTSPEFSKWLGQTNVLQSIEKLREASIPLGAAFKEFRELFPDETEHIKRQTFTKWLLKYFKEQGYKCKRMRVDGGTLLIQNVMLS
jgi:hypothetical protein